MLYHCMLTGSWHGSVNMAFMTCWIHDWFMTGWWLVVQDLWHVEESMAWIRKLWHKETVVCWRVHGMAQQSWHSWLVGLMVGSWLVHDSLFRIYGMLKSPWHESENYGITTVACAACMACWVCHGQSKWVAQKDFSITFVPAAASAKPVRLTCLFAWARQPGSYYFHWSMACSMVFAFECFVVSTHVLVHSFCRAQHWMPARIMTLSQSICCMDLHGISFFTDICCIFHRHLLHFSQTFVACHFLFEKLLSLSV